MTQSCKFVPCCLIWTCCLLETRLKLVRLSPPPYFIVLMSHIAHVAHALSSNLDSIKRLPTQVQTRRVGKLTQPTGFASECAFISTHVNLVTLMYGKYNV